MGDVTVAARGWSDVRKESQATRAGGPRELEKVRTWILPESSQKGRPCPPLDFSSVRLILNMASRTVRE